MKGYVFTLTDAETKNLSVCGGYPYALKERDRWKAFDFEESSIDLNISTDPRFVIDGIIYGAHRQYFIQEGSTTIRLIILHKHTSDCENVSFKPDGSVKGN